MMDFSAGAGVSTGGGDPIPNGVLLYAIVNVRGLKPSKSGGGYLDVELTIDDNQPFARRKIWTMVGDPNHAGNSEAYRQMGMVAISRMLESGRGAGPANPAAYHINAYSDLSGLRVPIKVKEVPAQNGYDAKNDVAEWLTPNPQSGCAKLYERLIKGDHGVQRPAQSIPRSNAAQQTNAFGGFGSQQQPAPAAQSGFGQPQVQGQKYAPSAAVRLQNAPASPSEVSYAPQLGIEQKQNIQPSWLAQANGG